jgi:hypothetical protein
MVSDIRETVIDMVEVRCRLGCGNCEPLPGYFSDGKLKISEEENGSTCVNCDHLLSEHDVVGSAKSQG